jgi:hypothetical protein
MTSKTGLANISLTRIGASKLLQNVDTQTGTLADAVKLLFPEESKFVLRDFPWPSATAYVALALVAGTASVPANNDWQYSYRYPAGCVFVRRIVVANQGRNNPAPPAFRIGRDSQGKLVYTNEPNAEVEFTADISDSPEEFDAMMVSMLAWKLGASLAPSQSLIKEMAVKCMEQYEIEKTKAQSRALNESQQEDPIESEFMRSRDA